MKHETPTCLEFKFSKEVIYQQLQKIFLDPLFINSDILRKFLLFIVEQTLLGHENWLKEYTIGVNVLNKPTNFKPQENGVVRIHAGRLRRALNHYYNELGALDPVQILVPKGSYVPVFNENNNRTAVGNDKISNDDTEKIPAGKHAVIAVIPFRHFHDNELENSFTEGLGLQLSSELMQFEKYSVIAYNTMCNVCEKLTDITEIASAVAAQYIFTGNIQSLDNRVRIHIQMINANTNQQLWSWMHEGKFTSENIFELQDEIIKLIISGLGKSFKLIDEKSKTLSMVAVA